MDTAKRAAASSASRTRSIAYVGLTIAVMAVSAWVTVPIGPVPFTLQLFAFAFALLVLRPKECAAAIAGYLALGALGVPVFSGMRGGIGILVGPSGGFLWGFLLGALAAAAVMRLARRRELLADIGGCVALVAVSYACGWLQYMVVMGVGPLAALLAAVAPFAVADVLKIAAAVAVARAVRSALGRRGPSCR